MADNRGQRPPGRGGIVNRETGEVLSPEDIDAEILRLGTRLEKSTDLYAVQVKDAAVKEVDHKKATAMVRVQKRTEGGHGPGGRATDQELEDTAVLATYELLMERRIAEELVRATSEMMRTYRTQIDYLRTLAANLRGQT